MILVSVTLLHGSCSSSSSLSSQNPPPSPTLSSISVTPPNPTIANGSSQQFNATGTYSDSSTQDLTATATWSSSLQTVAIISNAAGSNGLATSVGPGSTKIQASLNGVSSSTMLTVPPTLVSIGVTPANPTITQRATEQFTATGTYSDQSLQDLTNSVTWSSMTQGVATISNTAGSNGLATSVGTGQTTIQAALGAVNGSTLLTVVPAGVAAIATFHTDNGRTGQNTNETILTTSNVNVSQFGKLFALPVDGQLYAQPLYVANVTIGGTAHNVVFAATENDTVYAFDADSNTGANATYLWKASLIDAAHGAPAGAAPVSASGSCPNVISPTMGITSTPVIDTSANTMYVVAFSQEAGQFVNRLHAIDITTGNEKSQGPVVIDATVSGTGDGSSGGNLTFSQLSQFIRPGLLLSNGTVYLASAALCEGIGPFHGWVFGYNESTLSQNGVFVTTPNGGLGGIWMAGSGLAADSSGNLFVATGNGSFDTTNIPATTFGDTFLKLTSTLTLSDYFTPWNQAAMDGVDNDLGSGGVLLLPAQPGANPDELVEAGKLGTIYVVNRDQMTAGNLHYCTTCTSVDTQIVQELPGAVGGMWAMPAYWNSNVYFWGQADVLKQYSVTNGVLSASPVFQSTTSIGGFGTTPSISSNGTANGILWALAVDGLHAYEATNVGDELYDSTTAPNGRDAIDGGTVKFTTPIIANGKVYVGTATGIDVFGLLNN